MFEFHGWAVLRMTYIACDDEENKNIASILVELKHKIAYGNLVHHFCLHDGFNDMYSLTISGLRNHRQEEVIGLFAWLAKNAPGSYGLLYVLDDEDHRGEEYAVNFRVFRLARGFLQELGDPFLSPPVPAIEDAYEV
jgi:hypothetical protein